MAALATGAAGLTQEALSRALARGRGWLVEAAAAGALVGELRALRRLAWLVLLGALRGGSPEDWVDELEAHRHRYAAAVEDFDRETAIQALDPNLCNPLSRSAGNPFVKIRASEELLREIWKDVERTFSEDDLLSSTESRKALQRILLHWCRQRGGGDAGLAEHGYRQGMNELAAICFSVVKQGALAGAATQGPEPLGFRLCGPAHDEADAFTLFDQLMVGAAQLAMFTHPGTSACPRQPARSPVGELPRPRREPSAAEPGPPASAILARCRYIHDVLLKAVDGELHAHLQQLEVEPPVFLLRWLRLFFCREFELEEAVLLWDRIFADAHRTCSVSGPPYPSFGPDSAAIVREASAASSALPLVDYLAVALLVRQRGELLSGDQTDCLRRLMASARAPEQGAPSESSVEQLVEAAARLRGRLAERPYVTAEVCAPAPGRAATPEECPRRRQQLLNAVGGLFSAGRQSLARAGQRGEAALAAGAPAAGPEPAEGRGDSLAGWASDAPAATALATAPASLEVAELRRRVAAAEQERDAAQRRAAELHALRSAEWAAERAELEARLGGKDRRIAALEEELAHERRRGQRAHEPARDGASGGATAAGPSPVRATAALPVAGSKPPAGEDEVEGVVLGETFSG